MSAADIKATQDSAIFGALVDLCDSVITSQQIDKINAALQSAMREGNMAHAFDPETIASRIKPKC